MKKYTVLVREVHVSHREILAESPEDAIRRVSDGEDEGDTFFEYSHTMDTSTWSVEDENGKLVLD